MKIVIVCPASLPATQFGGILFLGVDIARELSNLNHQVTIYTTDLDFANNPNTFNKKLPREENIQNFKIKRSHVWLSLKLFFINPGIYFHMINDEQDIIHTIGIRSFQSLIAALIARKKKIIIRYSIAVSIFLLILLPMAFVKMDTMGYDGIVSHSVAAGIKFGQPDYVSDFPVYLGAISFIKSIALRSRSTPFTLWNLPKNKK